MDFKEIQAAIRNDCAVTERMKKIYGINCFTDLGLSRMRAIVWLDDALNRVQTPEGFEREVKKHLIHMTQEVANEMRRYCRTRLEMTEV